MSTVLLLAMIKDKAGKVCCLDIQRPIALASTISKVLERILLDRFDEFITCLVLKSNMKLISVYML